MIQLKLYNDSTKTEQYWIELYETEPIKLTLSVEDITNADATSTFSKAFKVPGTRKNAEFFKNAFDIDGILYDVTVKKPAEILVDGAEFKTGHVRLQKVFLNTDLDRYDYELLFLGETRDLSSIIGDKPLCQLVMDDLVPTDPASSIFTQADIELSWQAYPESVSLTAGLADGNLLFPLIDHGNEYDGGLPTSGVIELNNESGRGFTLNASNGLAPTRFKPMIRAKRIWDQIFDDAGYTYTSSFLNSNRFKQIYISAFGNEASSEVSINQSVTTSFQAEENVDTQGINCYLYLNDVVYNPGGQFSTGTTTCSGGSYYVAPATSTQNAYYIMHANADVDGWFENSDGSRNSVPIRIELVNASQGNALLANGPYITGSNSSLTFDSRNLADGAVTAGDILKIRCTTLTGTDYDSVENVYWDCTASPGGYYAPGDLDCNYKQIDFIKDILTTFRLTLSPDPKIPNAFIIEPWQTYINSGNLYDWSKKLVENKDVIVEPLFNTQSDIIEFSFTQDLDYINNFHYENYKHPYGWLEFNSGNELLKGTRKIEVKGIAPTPVDQIEQDDGSPHNMPTFIIPNIHKHNPEGAVTQHLPIKPKTRMLFYNGLKTIPDVVDQWYWLNINTRVEVYPQVTPYEQFPPTNSSLNLNFSNDIRYYLDPNPGTGYNQEGPTIYNEYWSRYINSLYNKYSRRVTAYFILNNIDLNEFSFDDTIFVNGTYYRPEKIIDVQIGAYTEVLVQLITANDYVPITRAQETLIDFTATGYAGDCYNFSGYIEITTQGTPPFTWDLGNGQTGQALVGTPAGAGPYTFIIPFVSPGTYNVTVNDSLGRTGVASATVPVGIYNPPTATQVITNATDCIEPCNGSIVVTPADGNAPYTIYWYDDPTETSFTRTGLCPGDYSYYITDSSGCLSASYLATVTCASTEYDIWDYARDFDCESLSGTFVKVRVPSGTTPDPINDIVTLTEIISGIPAVGCYRPIQLTTGLPQYEITQYWIDCESCNGITPEEYWVVESCELPGNVRTVKFTETPQVAEAWNLDNTAGCWSVVDLGNPDQWSGDTAVTMYPDCNICNEGGVTDYYHLIRQCNSPDITTYVARHSSLLNIGDSVKVSGVIHVGICYEVMAYVEGPEDTTVLEVFPTCDICNE